MFYWDYRAVLTDKRGILQRSMMTKTITEKDLTLKDLSLINAIQKNKSIDVFKRSFALSKYGSEKSYDGTFYEHDSTFHTWDVAVDLMNLLDNDDGTIGEMNRLLDLIYNVDTTSFQFYNKIVEKGLLF